MDKAVWIPKHPKDTNIWRFMDFVAKQYNRTFETYQELHAWSVADPEQFWQSLCDFFDLRFDTPATEVLNHYEEMLDARWFSGAHFNFAQKLLSRKTNDLAIISLNENGERLTWTYEQLYTAVAGCATALKEIGVEVGDRVAAVMPNTAYTLIAMLASTSLGAIWSSCSPDFGTQAALDRLGQIEPKVLFICDGHQYQGKKHNGTEKIVDLTKAIPSLKQVVVCPNIHTFFSFPELPQIVSWEQFVKPATECHFVSLPFDHPVYILFSSGTTGKPKCIMHGAGGTLLQHIKEIGLHTDLTPKDNLCFYTTCGWMMWNWMVSSLYFGATLTLYEGSPAYPDAGCLFKLIEQEQVSIFGTGAKFISNLEKTGLVPKTLFNLEHLRCILATGSPLLPKNYEFIDENIKPGIQVSSISGGTDIISCFALGNPIVPVYKGELQCLGLGMQVEIFDDAGQSIINSRGELVCTKPFPSMPVGFWRDDNNKLYRKAYFQRFPGVWVHGDFAEITEHGGLIIYGRSDAILNPGGVRIGTAEIYRQVETVDEVLDSVVIGQQWDDDVRVVLFVKLKNDLILTDELIKKIQLVIRQNTTPRHVPAKIVQVQDIPRTISGKTVEIAVRQAVHNEAINNLSSLANPEALEHFKNRSELK